MGKKGGEENSELRNKKARLFTDRAALMGPKKFAPNHQWEDLIGIKGLATLFLSR